MDQPRTYPKKQLSIFIEAPFLNRLLKILDSLEVPGYSVLPALAGRGQSGPWRRDSLSSDAGRMVQIIIILDAERVPSVLTAVGDVLQRQLGIVTLSDVEVLRPDFFT